MQLVTSQRCMFCDCSLQTPFGGAEQHRFQAQGMLMDAHCSCSQSACVHCQSLAIARVKKTRSAGLVAHLLPRLQEALQQHGPHAHAYINKHLTPCSTPVSPEIWHSPKRLPAKPWLPGLDTGQLTRDGCFGIDQFPSMQGHDNSFRGVSMQAAATKLLQPDHLMAVNAGATRHRSSLLGCSRCTACTQPSRQDCPHETRGQRLLPEHVSRYISPARGVLGDRSGGGHCFGKSQYHHGNCSGPCPGCLRPCHSCETVCQ